MIADADPVTGDPAQEDMDLILILTKDSYYIAHYDDEVDKVTNYQRVAFEDLELIELGPLDQSAFNLPFKSSSNRSQFCLRIHYRYVFSLLSNQLIVYIVFLIISTRELFVYILGCLLLLSLFTLYLQASSTSSSYIFQW